MAARLILVMAYVLTAPIPRYGPLGSIAEGLVGVRLRGLGTLITDLISSNAARFNVPPALALAVAQRESSLNQNTVGSKGEIGVFQLKPSTAADLGVDPNSLDGNIEGGVRYLSNLFGQFGDWQTALEAYNGGPTNVRRGTVSPAAQSYAESILSAAGLDSPVSPGFPSVPAGSEAVTEPEYDWMAASSTSGLDFGSPMVLGGLALLGVGLLLWARG
jgi:hypothetical protein